MSSSMGLGWHPIYEMENKKCSKPPTRNTKQSPRDPPEIHLWEGLHEVNALLGADLPGVATRTGWLWAPKVGTKIMGVERFD